MIYTKQGSTHKYGMKMSNSLLLHMATRWPGRTEALIALSSQGLRVIGQAFAVESQAFQCEDIANSLTYFDECGREFIASGGTADHDRRLFPKPTAYRSSFLDQLSEKVMGRDAGTDCFSAGAGLPLEDCYRRQLIASFRGGGNNVALLKSISKKIADLKRDEAERLELRSEMAAGAAGFLRTLL